MTRWTACRRHGKRNDRLHPPAQRSRRHRSRTGRAEGGQSGGARRRPACRRRAALRSPRRPIGISCAISASPTWRRNTTTADLPTSRKLSVQIRLALYQQPIAPEILEPLLAAWRAQRADGVARRGALLGADRGPQGRQFRRPVRKLPRPLRRNRIPDRGARLLGGAVDLARAPLHGKSRPVAGRHRDGRADPAADCRARLGRRLERDRRRPDADLGHLGARLGDRAGRGGARPHRARRKNGFLRTVEAGRKGHRDTCEHGVAAPQLVPDDHGERAVPDAGRGGDARPPAAASASSSPARRSRSNGRWTSAASSCCSRGRCTSRRRSCPTRSGCSIPASTAIPPASAGARAARWW